MWYAVCRCHNRVWVTLKCQTGGEAGSEVLTGSRGWRTEPPESRWLQRRMGRRTFLTVPVQSSTHTVWEMRKCSRLPHSFSESEYLWQHLHNNIYILNCTPPPHSLPSPPPPPPGEGDVSFFLFIFLINIPWRKKKKSNKVIFNSKEQGGCWILRHRIIRKLWVIY